VIVDATIAEVGAKGWAGTTVEGIAARAGVGRGSIYRRWPSKNELFQYAAMAIIRTPEATDTGSFADSLFAAVLSMAEMLSQPGVAAVLPALMAEAANDASVRGTLDTFVAQSRRQAIDVIERARRRGDVPQSTDAETLVDMLAGGLVYRLLLLGESIDAEAVRALVRQAVESCSTPTLEEDK
jgi:AcrR family transcriptional regulator